MEKDPKNPLVPHTLQQDLENKKDAGVNTVVDNEVELESHRKIYAKLLEKKAELMGQLETAKRNNNDADTVLKQKELDTTESTLAAYDRQFHDASVQQASIHDEAELAYEERNRHLH